MTSLMKVPANGLLVAVSVFVLGLLLNGCYRLASPPDLRETVRLEIVSNKGKLVRSQGYLTDAVGQALLIRLGWRVGPSGSAVLKLVIDEETIEAGSRNTTDVTDSWVIRIHGKALLVARGGSLTGTFTGVGNATGLATSEGEPQALQAAARQAADDLVTWLDVRARDVLPPAAGQPAAALPRPEEQLPDEDNPPVRP